ncbi:MAG: DnaA/Hda family protein [Pseudomonadota bacterium]
MTDAPQEPEGSPPKLDFGAAEPTLSSLDASPSNAAALRIVRRWREWPAPALCVVGPPACGLTTLSRAWAKEAGGRCVAAADVDSVASTAAVAIDDADLIQDEGALLTLLNQAGADDGRVLLTARRPPAAWDVLSKDLRSRLSAAPVVEIEPPDEEMTALRLRSACRRRYMKLPDDVVDYLCIRLERTYAGIERFVERLDALVDKTGRRPTIPLAREALEADADQPDLFE